MIIITIISILIVGRWVEALFPRLPCPPGGASLALQVGVQ